MDKYLGRLGDCSSVITGGFKASLLALLVFALLAPPSPAAAAPYDATRASTADLSSTPAENGITIESGYDPAMLTGKLKVTIQPAAAVSAGAQWRILGTTTWYNSGATITLDTGSYTVEFKYVSGWTKPANISVTVVWLVTKSYTVTYTLNGTLRVYISPTAARTAGARWKLSGSIFTHTSGTTLSLSPGNYTVVFTNISGWTTPANKTLTVASGNLTTYTGYYVQHTAKIKVYISPAAAIAAGAQWKRTTESTWHSSGYTTPPLTLGTYTVEFKSIASWAKPANKTFNLLSNGATYSGTGTYTEYGRVKVNIQPAAAVAAGAQWRKLGTSSWRNSGDTVYFSPGTHIIECKAITGWTKPSNVSTTVTSGNLNTITRTYTQNTGSLKVNIEPAGARSAGAMWRRKGSTGWRPSGYTETGVLAGPCTIEFNDVTGWTNPGDLTITIAKGIVNATTVTYAPAATSGSIKGKIKPKAARNGGGQWRVDGGGWRNHKSVAGVSAGDHLIEYKTIAGFNTPPNQTVTVVAGKTVKVKGKYISTSGPLSVTIAPRAAIDASAQWRIKGTDKWLDSGAKVAAEDYCEVEDELIVEFKPVAGWYLPELEIEIGGKAGNRYEGRYSPFLIADAADYNGDGKDDLAVFRPSNGRILVHGVLTSTFAQRGDLPAPGDYDGDGTADIAVFRPSTGEWLVENALIIKGFGREMDLPVPADYDGDGLTDPALYRPSTGEWIVSLSTAGAGAEPTVIVFGGERHDIPIPGDYNGDGLADPAVYSLERSALRVLGFDAVIEGRAGMIPVAADFQGIGRADLALVDPVKGSWRFLGKQVVIETRAAGEVPVFADLDGDGKLECGFFLPSKAKWVFDTAKSGFGAKGDVPLTRR